MLLYVLCVSPFVCVLTRLFFFYEGVAWVGVGLCCMRVRARVRYLDLSSNKLNGSFPSIVSGLSSLQ